MRIVILGSGLMGDNLGTLFARAGYEVVLNYAQPIHVFASGRLGVWA
jgi:3-hydroxyacyl-CoA dehydrogenase